MVGDGVNDAPAWPVQISGPSDGWIQLLAHRPFALASDQPK
jgi:hypothetical protein